MGPFELVDEAKLKAKYPEIHYHSDDNLLNAVVVSCGRMGIIYSVVLRLVRQYALHEKTVKQEWSQVKTWITDKSNPTFDNNTFVQIDVNAYGGFWHPSKRDCYIITRTKQALIQASLMTGGSPLGRDERGINPGTGANLGKRGWAPNPCHSDAPIGNALQDLRDELSGLREKACIAWIVAAAIIFNPLPIPAAVRNDALIAQQAAAGTIVITSLWIGNIALAIVLLSGTFGSTMAKIGNFCALMHLFPIYRCVYEMVSSSEHNKDHPYTPAISYAAMDQHDYLNVGCVAPGDSIEIFVDADSPQLPQFVDLVLDRVQQLADGNINDSAEVFGGYISLRFMGESEAFLAMQLWPRTCSIEIAGLSRVDGTAPLIRTIEEDAKSFDVVLHWGQRNNWSMKDIEKLYGSLGPSGRLFKWREALSEMTDTVALPRSQQPFLNKKDLRSNFPKLNRLKSFRPVVALTSRYK